MKARRPSKSEWTQLAVVAIFAVAMAYVESAVVVYLRTNFRITGELLNFTPSRHTVWLSLKYLTLLKPDALKLFLPNPKLAHIEVGREIATIVMLASMAWIAGRNWKARLGYFLCAFGIWDIGYYAFLRVLIGWPVSLKSLDVLFLIPGPWVSPVFMPLAVSVLALLLGVALVRSKG